MQRKKAIFGIAAFLVAGFTIAAIAAKTYKYKCPKCGLIQEYSKSGIYKCPMDGRTMIRYNR